MTKVTRPGEPPPPPPPRLPESEKARQVQTEKGLLEEVAQRSWFHGIPGLGWIVAIFVRRGVKAKYIASLQKRFVQEAHSRGWPQADLFFTQFLKPKLLSTRLEDLPQLDAFWAQPGGIEPFLDAKGKQVVPLIDLVIKAMKRNPEGTKGALANAVKVNLMMTGRFTPPHRLEYLTTLLKMVTQVEPASDFDEKVLPDINSLVNEAARIQRERPIVHMGDKQIAFVKTFFTPFMNQIREAYPLLKQTFEEIIDMTVVMNTQAIHEDIEVFFLPPSMPKRNIEALTPRYEFSPVTTSVERHAPVKLLEDSDREIDFRAETDLYITNAKTMETRCLRVPLPFEGKMTQTQARKLLKLLDETLKGPGRFDKVYKEQGLEPELQAERKERFLAWVENIEKEYGKCLFDFNPTPTRPAMSYALESEAVQAASQNLTDERAALRVAAERNLYRTVEGRLSLLPPRIASKHSGLAFISPLSLQQASERLLGKKTIDVPMQITARSAGYISFKTETTQIGSKTFLQLHTTWASGDKTSTRTTTYELSPHQKPADKLNEIVTSGLFERDLLLAKAKFLETLVG